MSSRQPPNSAASSSRTTLRIDAGLLNRFKPAKVFTDAVDHGASTSAEGLPSVVSLAFDDAGERCVTAGEDESFALWDARQGKKSKTFWSKKYGIGHVRFTHRSGNILHTSTKGDHAVRYHSMHDNKYLSYFRGHEDMVRSVHMNPADDTFISSGDDRTVRLWDLRSPICRGALQDMGGSLISAFDNTGQVFAVACSETQTIALYAHATMDHSPFIHAAILDHALADISVPPPIPIITSISFSNDGVYILVGTSSDFHYVLDAFSLEMVRRLTGHQGLERDNNGTKGVEPRRGRSGEEVCWTGDSKFVVSGSNDGSICIWDLTPPPGQEKLTAQDPVAGDTKPNYGAYPRPPTLEPVAKLQGKSGASQHPTRAVRFNPKFCMFASGGEDLTFWLPEKDEQMLVDEGF